MRNTLAWKTQGKDFEDGSLFSNWVEVYKSDTWHWQYDSHELTFAIYKNDNQYWKLYHARFVHLGETEYSYGFGGQACRMVCVEYKHAARSPHSKVPKCAGEKEWIRTYEFNADDHEALIAGEENAKYGPAYGKEVAA